MRLIDGDQMAQTETEAYMAAQAQIEELGLLRANLLAHAKVQKLIADAPTVDAVPVVRCRECEHAELYERTDGTAGYYCGHPQNAFVYGERWERVFKPVKSRTIFAASANVAPTNLRTCAIWTEVEPMPPGRRRDIADGLLILLSVIMLLVVFCAAWSHYDRLGWVRFVSALPFPSWVKSILWGWA